MPNSFEAACQWNHPRRVDCAMDPGQEPCIGAVLPTCFRAGCTLSSGICLRASFHELKHGCLCEPFAAHAIQSTSRGSA